MERAIPFNEIPWCEKNAQSSAAIKASIRCFGIELNGTGLRFSRWNRAHSLPWSSNTTEGYEGRSCSSTDRSTQRWFSVYSKKPDSKLELNNASAKQLKKNMRTNFINT